MVLEAGSVFEIKGQRWMIAALFTGNRDVLMPDSEVPNQLFTAKHRHTMKRLHIDAETVLPVWFENPVCLSDLKEEALLSAIAKEKLLPTWMRPRCLKRRARATGACM